MTQCLEAALTISIKAAKGENINEADDWKKNLKLKYRDKLNKPAVTEEFVNKILEQDYQSLLNNIDSELSEFYSIFSSFIWDPDIAKYTFIANTNTYISTMTVTKATELTYITRTIEIRLIIKQFAYQIEISLTNGHAYYNNLYNKEFSYIESLTEQDRSEIVNAIGNFLNVFLENNNPI